MKSPLKTTTAHWQTNIGPTGRRWNTKVGYAEVKSRPVQRLADDGHLGEYMGMGGQIIGSIIGSYFGGPIGGQAGGMAGKDAGGTIGDVIDKKRPVQDAFLPPGYRSTDEGQPAMASNPAAEPPGDEYSQNF